MTKKYRISGESFEKSYFGKGYDGLVIAIITRAYNA